MTAPLAALTTPDTVAVAVGPPGPLSPHAATRIDVTKPIASVWIIVEICIRPSDGDVNCSYLANGSGRSWNRYTLLVVPFPPSMWKGARVLIVAQRPRPFQPAFASSMRPSSHLV